VPQCICESLQINNYNIAKQENASYVLTATELAYNELSAETDSKMISWKETCKAG